MNVIPREIRVLNWNNLRGNPQGILRELFQFSTRISRRIQRELRKLREIQRRVMREIQALTQKKFT